MCVCVCVHYVQCVDWSHLQNVVEEGSVGNSKQTVCVQLNLIPLLTHAHKPTIDQTVKNTETNNRLKINNLRKQVMSLKVKSPEIQQASLLNYRLPIGYPIECLNRNGTSTLNQHLHSMAITSKACFVWYT